MGLRLSPAGFRWASQRCNWLLVSGATGTCFRQHPGRRLPFQVSGGSSVSRPSSSSMPVEPWEIGFGELEIQRPIGEGSFGRVYEVHLSPGEARSDANGGTGEREAPHTHQHSAPAPRRLPPPLQGTWHSTAVAIKVLLAGPTATARQAQASLALPPPVLARLEGEASLLASLRHPNVVGWEAASGASVPLAAHRAVPLALEGRQQL